MKVSGSLTSAFYYLLNVKELATLATALGKTDDANKYNALFASLSDKFNAAFFDKDTLRYDNGVQTGLKTFLFVDSLERRISLFFFPFQHH
jgi:hypothetical protein